MNLKQFVEHAKEMFRKNTQVVAEGIHKFTLTDKKGRKKVFIKKNTIVMAGREEVGKILAGITMSTQGINYAALGTGAVAITDGDTVLEAEGARKLRGSSESNDDSFIVAFYFGPDEANGSWTRYATFIDGTETADTGKMFTHLEIALTKLSGEGLSIVSEYTIATLT